jgi:hypothetical protein
MGKKAKRLQRELDDLEADRREQIDIKQRALAMRDEMRNDRDLWKDRCHLLGRSLEQAQDESREAMTELIGAVSRIERELIEIADMLPKKRAPVKKAAPKPVKKRAAAKRPTKTKKRSR